MINTATSIQGTCHCNGDSEQRCVEHGKGSATRSLQLVQEKWVAKLREDFCTLLWLDVWQIYAFEIRAIIENDRPATSHEATDHDGSRCSKMNKRHVKALTILEPRTCRHAASLESSIRDPHSTLLSSSRACSSAFSLLHASIFSTHVARAHKRTMPVCD